MPERTTDDARRLGGKCYENVDEYVAGLAAAIRTHKRLSNREDAELTVEIDPDMELPTVQRVLLR